MRLREKLVSVFLVLLFLLVLWLFLFYPATANMELAQYYLTRFQEDTGAKNAVAAIYLNYRMYDTLFEALMLLISIIAMIHFFKAGGEHHG